MAVDLGRLNHFQGNAGLPAELAEDLDVAPAVVTEEKVLAFDHSPSTELAQHDALEELRRAERQEGRIGGIGDHGIDSQFLQQASFVLGPT